jgi:hypothetical protein
MLILARSAGMPAYAQTADQDQSDEAGDTDDEPSCDQPQTATYVAQADKAGFGIVFFSICVDPTRESEMRNEIKRTLSCQNGPEMSSFRSEGLIGLEANCEFPLIRNGLRFSGAFDVSGIQKILTRSGENRSLDMTLLLPYGNAGCEPKPQNTNRIREILDCTYRFASTQPDPPEIRFSFGYSTAEIEGTVGILGFLLVLPVAATLWLRQRAQRASGEEREAVWFALLPVVAADDDRGSAGMVDSDRSAGSRRLDRISIASLGGDRDGSPFDSSLGLTVVCCCSGLHVLQCAFSSHPPAARD